MRKSRFTEQQTIDHLPKKNPPLPVGAFINFTKNFALP